MSVRPVLHSIISLISLALVSCLFSCTSSSGVVKLGPDAYTVSASAPPLQGGSAKAQKIALSEANEFCAKSGNEIHVIELKVSSYNADVIFRCVDRAAPRLQQQ